MIVMKNPTSKAVFEAARKLAPGRTSVLILGEQGSGRGVVARHLHERGDEPQAPFRVVSCAAMADLPAMEDGGTIFLREIDRLRQDLQDPLSRILTESACGARIVASGSVNLSAKIGGGSFSPVLYGTVARAVIRVPPLRERAGDIPELVAGFLERLERRDGRSVRLAEAVMGYLLDYDWPGNVAELEHLIGRLFEGRSAGDLSAEDLPPQIRWFPGKRCDRPSRSKGEIGFNPLSEEFQIQLIADALRRTRAR